MKRNDTSVKIGVTSLLFSLLLVLLSSVIAGAQNEEIPLTVDMWTDRGGQGIGVLDGGTYQVGEETIFYLYVSTTCQVKWTIKNPLGTDVREETLKAGTHQYPDEAEGKHVGQWEMTFEAWTEEEYAFDLISFTIVKTGEVSPEPDKDQVVGLPGVDILADNFNLENEGRGQLNYSDFANWDVTRGSVDLIGHDFHDFFKGHGLYLDLDGTTGNAGRLESKTRFRLDSGDYQLEFDLAGNPKSGPNTVTVSLGNLYSEDFTLEANEEFGTIARTIRVPTTTSAKLIFDHSGGDNEGLILDNVKLTKVSGEILKREEGALDLSRAGEAWAREWAVLSTLTDFVGGKAGFYPEAVRSGHANPNPGRTGILYLHPKSQQEPARITRRVTMTGPAPILTMGVSGNRDVDGDWVLVVKVDGKSLGEKKVIAGAQGWQDLEFDLSPFSGQTVTIEIEAWANDWHYEYAFFDYVE